MSAAKLLAALAIASAALSASATTYYWKPGATQGLWSTPSNWSTESVDGATANTPPGNSDSLYSLVDFNVNLGGITNYLNEARTDGGYDTAYAYIFENGALQFSGELRRFRGSIDINNGATLLFPSGSTIYTGVYQGVTPERRLPVNINNGGNMEVRGIVRFYNTRYIVNQGGSLTFAPSALKITAEKNACAAGIENFGTLNLPNGLSMNQFDYPDYGASFTLWQTSGILNLGGPITTNSIPGTFNVNFAGGVVNVTGNASFDVTETLVSGPVTFNVAEGKTLDTTSLEIGNEGSLTKAGPGYIAFPTTAQAVTISEGGVALNSGTYNLSAVTFAAGTTVHLASFGGTINQGCYPDTLTQNAMFTANLSDVVVGTIIFNSNDSTLLGKVQTDLASSLPTGLGFVVNGSELSVETQSSYNFGGVGDILDASYWGGNTPGTSAEVAITGATTVATLSHDSLPQWNSIEVKDGATLCISTTATLPPIILNKQAKLEITNGAIVTLAKISDLSGVATAQQLPILSIAAGASLRVPGSMKFSNVNIDLKGQIAANSEGGMTFGYAPNGETTYFGLSSNGGTISITPGSGDYNTSSLQFGCPEQGGSVNVIGNISLKSTTILPSYTRSNVTYPFSVNHQVGFLMGVNNPSSIIFEVVFDNTTWGALGSFYVKGGATFRLANGGAYKNFESIGYWGRYGQVAERGKIVVGHGCEFRLNAMGDWGSHALEIFPDPAGHQAIVVEDDGIFETYRSAGNGKAVFSASNSIYQIYMPNLYNEHYSESEQTTTIYDTTNVPFMGFSSVNIADNSTLTFSTRNKVFWDNGQFGDDSGERVVALADVPITGGGSVALSNDNVNVFGVIVTCGSNTATGTAGVIPPADGKGETTLYFANGANWAGTVTAGNFATTNLVDATAACTNSFGTLDLADGSELKLRVRKTNGAIVSHDGLNVGTYVNKGGRIVLEPMDDPLMPGDTLVIGTIGKDSPMPTMAGHWRTERDANDYLRVKYSVGLSVIIR